MSLSTLLSTIVFTIALSLTLPFAVLHAQNTHSTKKISATQPQDAFANFAPEIGQFIDDMAAQHDFDRSELKLLFSKVRYLDSAIKLIKPAPPGSLKNWLAYRQRFVEPVRIAAGAQFWHTYASELARAEREYGVPAEIIVAIIGVETVYGRNTGDFRVMDAITTLAFDYPDTPTRQARMQFFRGELENTLLFARESHIDPFSLLGSYAGAIGLPQFMPSSIRQYAVDFDGKGVIDLRNSPIDAIGSVANFLRQHGWQRNLPLVFPARVNSDGTWPRLLTQGLEARNSISAVKATGVEIDAEVPADLQYGLVDLQNGLAPTEYWLATNNFFAITKYNRSYFYAMSVIDLSRAIRAARER